MPLTEAQPTSLDDLAGLLVTKEAATPKRAARASESTEAPELDEAVAGELEDIPEPGEGGNDDGDDVWNSPEEAEDAILAEEHPEGDAEGAADESGSGEGNPDDENANNEPFYTVKHGGKEERKPLSEIIAGYQRNADYTQKTQELAAQRATADAELANVQKARGAYDAMLADLQAKVEGTLTRKPEEWDALRAQDPVTFATEWADHQRRLEARNTLVAERRRVADEALAENNKKLREIIASEQAKLIDAVPVWRDPAKHEAGMNSLRSFVQKTYGFSEQDAANAYDHRTIRMALDAMRYRALVAKQAKGAAKVANAPVVPARGRMKPQTTAQRRTEDATKRFHKTGKIDDAVSLILAR